MHLHAVQFGNNSATEIPIIILHGLFGNNRNWYPVARALSEKHSIYSLDLRNHGESDHSDKMDYPSMAGDILDFIKQKKFSAITIVAHSMGGKAAMWLALNYPDVVHKLIVVDIAPVSYKHRFSEVLAGFKAVPLSLIKSRQEADDYLSALLDDRHLRQFLLQNLKYKEGQHYWRLNLEAISRSMAAITAFPKEAYQPFKKRVLFIAGGQSDYLTKENQRKTRELFPMASFSTIKSAGHWLHAEQPELFLTLIQPYLDSRF